MGQIILEIILIIFIVFITDLLTYKYVRFLDKKERTKLAEKETQYLKNLIKEMENK